MESKKRIKNYFEDIKNFYLYVWEFYNIKTGVYPIATDEKIQHSVNLYLESKPLGQIYFDSFDREEVRKIIDPNYRIL